MRVDLPIRILRAKRNMRSYRRDRIFVGVIPKAVREQPESLPRGELRSGRRP